MATNTVNLDDFNAIHFFNKYKNLNRLYLFNVLNEINLLSYGKNKNDFSITFDSLTKIGNLLQFIKVDEVYVEKLNNFFVFIMQNNKIGYALPIFKYRGVVYAKTNRSRKIDLNSNELESLTNELLDNLDTIIVFDIKITDNQLTISYDNLENLIFAS